MIPFILLAAGLLLIFFEFYMPGGILGTLGGAVIIASIVTFAATYDSPVLIILYTLFCLALLALLVKYALWRIVHAKPDKSVYSDGSQEGYVASSFDHALVGKTVTVATDLRPGGQVVFEGRRHAALSLSGYIPKGEKVVVTGGQGETLTVKLQKKEKGNEEPTSR